MRESSLSSRQAIILLGVVVIIWGTTWPVNKAILHYMSPIWSTAIRMTYPLTWRLQASEVHATVQQQQLAGHGPRTIDQPDDRDRKSVV